MLHTPSLADAFDYHQLKSGKWVGPTKEELMAKSFHWRAYAQSYDERGKFVDSTSGTNLVTREGIGYLIGCGFANTGGTVTRKGTWYVTQAKAALGSIATTDTASTLATHFTEIVYLTDVTQSARVPIVIAGISTGADVTEVDNSASNAVFNQSTSITLYGIAVISVSVAGTSTGYTGDILYGEVAYGTNLVVLSGYQVNVQVQIQATAG